MVGMLGLIGVEEGDVAADGIGRDVSTLGFVGGGLAAVVGFALFGVATFRSGVLSRPGPC